MELSPAQIRVLGSLLEKERTTPQLYPMTESAIVTACNQTTNRDPVVAYDQSAVRRTLLELRQQGLARMVHRPGDRVEKHRHLLDEAWMLSDPELAVLAMLMLRGPQTVGELRTRTERLHAFGSVEDVQAVLQALATREPEPFVERMERQAGQKEARYRHVLSDDALIDAAPAAAGTPAQAAAPVATAAPAPPPHDVDAITDAAMVAALRDEIAALRRRVDRLERELGLA